LKDASWHVKVWPTGRPSGGIGYRVAVGIFELKMVARAHKESVLHVIGDGRRETGIVFLSAFRSEPINNVGDCNGIFLGASIAVTITF
jgi:hypothetical protein